MHPVDLALTKVDLAGADTLHVTYGSKHVLLAVISCKGFGQESDDVASTFSE